MIGDDIEIIRGDLITKEELEEMYSDDESKREKEKEKVLEKNLTSKPLTHNPFLVLSKKTGNKK